MKGTRRLYRMLKEHLVHPLAKKKMKPAITTSKRILLTADAGQGMGRDINS